MSSLSKINNNIYNLKVSYKGKKIAPYRQSTVESKVKRLHMTYSE